MRLAEIYDYLVRARRDLWAALETAPDEVLSRQVLDGSRLHCIKDLVFHIASVEDGWIHEDILRVAPILDSNAELKDTPGGAAYATFAIEVLLDYWREVAGSTTRYIEGLSEEESRRVVALHDSPDERYTLDHVLWHVMIHEMRHTAQIVVLLRAQGIKPPSLDLLFYLPPA